MAALNAAILRYHILNSEKRKAGTGTAQLTTGLQNTVLVRRGITLPIDVHVVNNTVTSELGAVAKIIQYDLRGGNQTGGTNATTIHKIDKLLLPDINQL